MTEPEENPVDRAPLPAVGEDGVDVTLIRWMLSLTPAERLEFLQPHIDDVQAIQEKNSAPR